MMHGTLNVKQPVGRAQVAKWSTVSNWKFWIPTHQDA